jgi:hypothetical protein
MVSSRGRFGLRIILAVHVMMDLRPALDDQFWQEIQQYEQEKQMLYITSVERIGIEKGKRVTARRNRSSFRS